MNRQSAPLFGNTRMLGDAQSSYLAIVGTGLCVEVVGNAWSVRGNKADASLRQGTASGPQAAANAARNEIVRWGMKVRTM
jgi:hypothetical protein